MKRLIVVLTLCASSLTHAQSLTGTWLSFYYRDKPNDKRLYFYRLYLKHSNDSLYGVCESLNIPAAHKNLHPNNATVTSRQAVYNHSFSGTDRTSFQLNIGTTFKTGTFTLFASARSLPNQQLICKVVPKEVPLYSHLPIIYSTVTVANGAVGEMLLQKVSDSVPDFAVLLNNRFSNESNAPKTKDTISLLRSNAKKEEAVVLEKPEKALSLEQRKNIVQGTIKTTSALATIELYDNGEIDNDTVSLYLNGQPLLIQKRLSQKPLQMEVQLQPNKENEFLLFAQNLGKIPPNTALLVITTGGQRHVLTLTGTLQTNAVVKIRVTKPETPSK